MLKAILCQDIKGGIGRDNSLPWKIKSEMQHFISETTNKTIVMGRGTFNSLNNKPLKNRKNIVLTKNKKYSKIEGVTFINDYSEIIELSKREDVYIIGGAQIYGIFEDYIDEYIISTIDNDYNCDLFFKFSKIFFNLKSSVKFDDFKLEKWIRNHKIINGRKYSNEILKKIKGDFEENIKNPSKFKFKIIQVGDNYSSSIYVAKKIIISKYIGIDVEHIVQKESITQDKLIDIIKKLNNNSEVAAILVQLPLPKHIDENLISSHITPLKDIDCFNPLNLGVLFRSSPLNKTDNVVPCTPFGVINILKHYKVDLVSKNVVIINRSNIVGKPLSILFLNENSTITICHTKTKNLKSICKNADILISATGQPKSIDATYIKNQAICIDIGISSFNGRVSGDFDLSSVEKVCSFITPVPFGIGPMTIAMLFTNFMKLLNNKGVVI